jgi:hypothetical protein
MHLWTQPGRASASTRDNDTMSRRRSFIRQHLFIPAGMVTMGLGCCTTSTSRTTRGEDTSPLRPHQHRANVPIAGGNHVPPPVPPQGGGGGDVRVVTAKRRRTSQRAQPGRAHAGRRGGRGEGSGDPIRAHGPDMRSGEARAARRRDPRRRRRALAERSGDGPARGPAREGQIELEGRVLQGVSAVGQKDTGLGGGVSKALCSSSQG